MKNALLHGRYKSVSWLSFLFKHIWAYQKLSLSLPLWESVNCAATCSHSLAWHARTHLQTTMHGCMLHINSSTCVLQHICKTHVSINVFRLWKKKAQPLISVYLCLHYKAPYSGLFIHRIANIIRIAGESALWERMESSGKMYKDLTKNMD